MTLPTRPLTVLIAALGGEGGGVMADWLIDAATHCGFPAQDRRDDLLPGSISL
jgi:Pyruvate/2-oxoacid:ferredoxin oxidoreductase gamma subunit